MIPRIEFESKLSGETVTLTFPFTLPEGATISSATVVASVYSGTDSNPSAILSGSDSTSGSNILQKVTGGVEGVIYQLLCSATLSDGQILQLAGYLAVTPALL